MHLLYFILTDATGDKQRGSSPPSKSNTTEVWGVPVRSLDTKHTFIKKMKQYLCLFWWLIKSAVLGNSAKVCNVSKSEQQVQFIHNLRKETLFHSRLIICERRDFTAIFILALMPPLPVTLSIFTPDFYNGCARWLFLKCDNDWLHWFFFQLNFWGLAFAGTTKMSPWALRTWNFTYLLTKQLWNSGRILQGGNYWLHVE